jgi:hypothetical protein
MADVTVFWCVLTIQRKYFRRLNNFLLKEQLKMWVLLLMELVKIVVTDTITVTTTISIERQPWYKKKECLVTYK